MNITEKQGFKVTCQSFSENIACIAFIVNPSVSLPVILPPEVFLLVINCLFLNFALVGSEWSVVVPGQEPR